MDDTSIFSKDQSLETSEKRNAEKAFAINKHSKPINLDQVVAPPLMQKQLSKRQSKTSDQQRIQLNDFNQ